MIDLFTEANGQPVCYTNDSYKKYKRVIKTSINQIADYWIENNDIDECILNFDWSEAHTHCWNCGDDKYRKSKKIARLERAHIIPHALGGGDTPSDYVLLCKSCHEEAPNINNKDDMWDWIKSNYMPFAMYNTYKLRKALVMFKQKEGYSFFSKKTLNENWEIELQKCFKSIGTHVNVFNVSTYYYLLKKIYENL